MITAKVKSIEGVKPFDGRNGTIYYHKLVMDNGDVGEIGKKKNNAYQIGDEITYTIDATEYGNKFKEVFQGSNTFAGGKQAVRGSSASFALAYAKDHMVAAMPLHPDVTVSQWVDVTLAAAKKFHDFLKERE